MRKDKKMQDRQKEEEIVNEDVMASNAEQSESLSDANDSNNELEALKAQLEEKSKKSDEYFGALQRMAAEFDNYKKRTAREREALCSDVAGDVVLAFLPVVDNLERALQAANTGEEEGKSIREGVEMVYRQMKEVMKKLDVEEVKSVGENFDPQIHNAVMHVEDESVGENMVVEEFQKGYTVKGRVVRHSMVKVAN